MKRQVPSAARHRRGLRVAIVAMAATTGFLAAGQPAAAQVGVGVIGVVGGNGVLAGNVIQIPITAVVAIQVCNNAIAIGAIGIPPNLLGSGQCAAAGDALGAAPGTRSTAKQRQRRARHARAARSVTRRGG